MNDSAVPAGIDSHHIDGADRNSRPVHTVLLGNDVLIVEHLCKLHLLPGYGFLFNTVPPNFRSAGMFPVRAFAIL